MEEPLVVTWLVTDIGLFHEKGLTIHRDSRSFTNNSLAIMLPTQEAGWKFRVLLRTTGLRQCTWKHLISGGVSMELSSHSPCGAVLTNTCSVAVISAAHSLWCLIRSLTTPLCRLTVLRSCYLNENIKILLPFVMAIWVIQEWISRT